VNVTDDSFSSKSLRFVLSMIAGSMDAVCFLGLGGLFVAHITGNLVMVAVWLAGGGQPRLGHLVAIPVFIAALGLAKLLAAGLQRIRIASLLPLLILQLLLLSAFLAICVVAGPRFDPDATSIVIAGMLGVCAIAVQNALVQISLNGMPSTAVMTTNITRLTMDLGEMLLARRANDRVKAGERASCTATAIAGFVLGCGIGAACEAYLGLWSLVVPTGFALIALALGAGSRLGKLVFFVRQRGAAGMSCAMTERPRPDLVIEEGVLGKADVAPTFCWVHRLSASHVNSPIRVKGLPLPAAGDPPPLAPEEAAVGEQQARQPPRRRPLVSVVEKLTCWQAGRRGSGVRT
jgi:uncharacterized membrane protein YoaK (UPF0700 family)